MNKKKYKKRLQINKKTNQRTDEKRRFGCVNVAKNFFRCFYNNRNNFNENTQSTANTKI